MTHDAVMYRRKTAASKKTLAHVYMCEEHAADMLDFLKAYEGKEKNV